MKKKASPVRTVIAVVVCIIASFAVIYLITILVNISDLNELGYSWRNDYSDDLEKTIITNDK